MKIRRFRAGEGRVYTLPSSLKGMTAGHPTRLACPTVIATARDTGGMITELELDFDNFDVQRHARDVNIALANGDFVEVTDQPASSASSPIAEPAKLPPPPSPNMPSSPPPGVAAGSFVTNPGAPPAKGSDR